ncbi:polycomb group protein EMBRYONIC FLOWER 2-like [Dorcoceras hygrometricum]|uniref:Polycomb group protein EMBRYONIC FLOWER 2-like n=1 Tax=Dorcoceras hygrometricum TaxID=472368 RepID=A0A2Z7D0I7_9LAMI|nr:polycomb group protein EMBRYONIC FLOWER 2-like [Dorcoceras hygrometricum]
MVLLERMRHRIAYSDFALVSEICSSGHDQMSKLVNDNPRLLLFTRTLFSVDCRRSSPPFGVRFVALSSSSLRLLIDTSLETGVAGFEEREVVAVFVGLCDSGPVVIMFFNSLGYLYRFELVVASAELPWSCLGSRLELVASPFLL